MKEWKSRENNPSVQRAASLALSFALFNTTKEQGRQQNPLHGVCKAVSCEGDQGLFCTSMLEMHLSVSLSRPAEFRSSTRKEQFVSFCVDTSS